MKRIIFEQLPASVYTCDDCAGHYRAALTVFPVGTPDVRKSPDNSFCTHCAWCGRALHIPTLHGKRATKCLIHLDDCPDYLPAGTIVGARVMRFMDHAGLPLNDDGVAELAELMTTMLPSQLSDRYIVTVLSGDHRNMTD